MIRLLAVPCTREKWWGIVLPDKRPMLNLDRASGFYIKFNQNEESDGL